MGYFVHYRGADHGLHSWLLCVDIHQPKHAIQSVSSASYTVPTPYRDDYTHSTSGNLDRNQSCVDDRNRYASSDLYFDSDHDFLLAHTANTNALANSYSDGAVLWICT